MPTLQNPLAYQSPIAGALSNLFKAYASGPDEAKKVYEAEAALKLQRQRQGSEAVADMVSQYGTPNYDPRSLASVFARAAMDPGKMAEYQRFLASNVNGATSPEANNAFVGAGGAYGSTAAGFREGEATKIRQTRMNNDRQLYEFNNKPVTIGTATGPMIARQSDAYGQPAVEDLGKVKGDYARRAMNQPGGFDALPQSGRVFIGADKERQQTPRMYMSPSGERLVTYDGIHDARTGIPLPAGGSLFNVQGTPDQSGLRPNVQAELQNQNIANQRFRGLLDYTRNLAQADANNFGVTGIAKGLVQDSAQIAGNIAQGLGYAGVQEAVNAVRQRATASGINPRILSGLFDPKLPALHTAADLLVYSAAQALAGQQGRNVSDRDVKIFKEIAGDPREWFGNQEKFLSKLDTMQQILDLNQNVTQQSLRSGAPGSTIFAPSQSVLPALAPAVPPSPVEQSPMQTEVWERGPDGRPVRVR
jgi:hypothetical protein